MISTPSSAAQPDWKKIWCHCNRWEGYELGYSGPSHEALQDELAKGRRTCKSFLRYRPGWSPDEHRQLVLKKEEIRWRWLFLLAGTGLGSAVTWLAGKLGPG
jgi:hypothetical protein